MAQRGHQVTVIFPRQATPAKPVVIENVKIVYTSDFLPARLRSGGFGLFDTLSKTIAVLRTKFDIIHTCPGHRPAGLIPALFAKAFRKSVVVDEWWEWFGKGGYADLRKGFFGACVGLYDSVMELRSKRSYDGVIAITNSLAGRLVDGTQVIVLNGGSDVGSLVSYDKAEARRELTLPGHLVIIGMSGLALNDHPDNIPLFNAVTSLFQNHPNVRLLVTGDSEYIDHTVTPLLPKKALINVGWVDYRRYNLYLSACDAFVLPFPDTCRNRSRWPNKIGDYLALERPIITNPTGDLETLFSKYHLGYLCTNTSEAYQGITRQIAGCTENTWKSRQVAQVLSFEKRVDTILQFYEHLRVCRKRKS